MCLALFAALCWWLFCCKTLRWTRRRLESTATTTDKSRSQTSRTDQPYSIQQHVTVSFDCSKFVKYLCTIGGGEQVETGVCDDGMYRTKPRWQQDSPDGNTLLETFGTGPYKAVNAKESLGDVTKGAIKPVVKSGLGREPTGMLSVVQQLGHWHY